MKNLCRSKPPERNAVVSSIVAVFAALFVMADQPPTVGSISGEVVNASRDDAPLGDTEIVLRVMLDGQFVIAAEGVTDEQGRFLFDNLPASEAYVYLPGANRQGVHYPGSRIRLSDSLPHARLKVPVHDAVTEPNPLVIRRHQITLRCNSDTIEVSESLLVDNPSQVTYVGDPGPEGGRATTLRLSIPSHFHRVTFAEEFFGSQFTLHQGQLVTDIPWTPGQRKLAFTYVVPRHEIDGLWQRRIDLPCQSLQIDVHSESANQIRCNLPRVAEVEPGLVRFTLDSSDETLPVGHLVELQLDRQPVSLASVGRWLALALLIVLVAATILIRSTRPPASESSSVDQPTTNDRSQAA